LQREQIKKGAEADIYLIDWGGYPAISKVRSPKPYRHPDLDKGIRRHRTTHEANFIAAAKKAGIVSPFIFFVDPMNAEIIMEFVKGPNVKDCLTLALCHEIGRYAARLHSNNMIHGDLTTSNFITNGNRLVLLDFGLAYYSERTEDAATDVRLIKEVFASAHVSLKGAYDAFVKGYASVVGAKKLGRINDNVREIEQRGRYARVT
jgi:TP53 regulating kinase-like protein